MLKLFGVIASRIKPSKKGYFVKFQLARKLANSQSDSTIDHNLFYAGN